MGVWIEIHLFLVFLPLLQVTPFMGVWIEICYQSISSLLLWSLPLWECGLK